MSLLQNFTLAIALLFLGGSVFADFRESGECSDSGNAMPEPCVYDTSVLLECDSPLFQEIWDERAYQKV